jgi:hypothetical protein
VRELRAAAIVFPSWLIVGCWPGAPECPSERWHGVFDMPHPLFSGLLGESKLLKELLEDNDSVLQRRLA